MPSCKWFLATGAIFGGLLYLIFLKRSGKTINFWHMVETGLAGGLLLGACHLFGCAFYPEHLVHVRDNNGTLIDPSKYHFELGDFHFLEILSASMAFVGGSIVMFIKFLPYPPTTNTPLVPVESTNDSSGVRSSVEDLSREDLEYHSLPLEGLKKVAVRIEQRGRLKPTVHDLDDE